MGNNNLAGVPAPGLRAFRAIVISLLVGVLGLASVGLAGEQETSLGATSDDPWFGVPEPRVGDKGMYELQIVRAEQLDDGHGHVHGHHGHHGPAESEDTATFEWAEPGELYDRNGLHYYTNDLVFHASEPERILHLDQASGESVGLTHPKESRFALTVNTATGPVRYTESSNWTTLYEPGQTDAHNVLAPCGMLNPLQGTSRNLSQPVQIPRPCSVWGVWGVTAQPAQYVLDHMAESDGVRLAAFVLDPNAPVEENVTVVTEYHFREDLAYPIKIEFGGAGLEVTAELVGLERGDRPLGTTASSQPPLPAVELVTPPAWGLDDAGLAHPYPLSLAWEDAVADPRSGLAAYLRDHPDAYATYAAFEQYERDATTEHIWRITVTDGSDPLTVCPGRSSTAAALPSVPGSSVEAATGCPGFGIGGPSQYQPGERPTAESLRQVWGQLAPLMGIKGEPLDYGFLVHGSQDFLTETIWIAYEERELRTADSARSELMKESSEHERAEIRFTPDGRVEAYTTAVQTKSYGEPQKGFTGTTTHGVASLDGSPKIVRPGFAPTAKEVGAVGGIALGAAALYWLWPWLNQVLFTPLFSRIQKPKVLDHERRQRILAAVSAEPGVHFEELQRRTGLARGTLRHHLQMLVQNEVIGCRQGGGYTCYYPKGEVDVRSVDARVAVRSRTAQKVLEAWQADPSLSGTELAERLGLSRQAVHYHMKRLKGAGLAP